MRKANKEICDRQVLLGLLESCAVGRLGTIGREGYPMVKPLNFAHAEGSLYFHTAKEGEKIDDIRRDNRVCFEVDLPIAYRKGGENPCRAEYFYRSVIIRGRAHIVTDPDEQRFGLACLMQKYQPEGGYGTFPPEKLAITGVVRIEIEEMTGKEDLGKDGDRQQVEAALREGRRLPIVIE